MRGGKSCSCSKKKSTSGSGDKWIQKALDTSGKKYAPRGAGTLTAQAKRAGVSVAQFARDVEQHPDKYQNITHQRVQLYRNLMKMKK